jgi:hypothetical protein
MIDTIQQPTFFSDIQTLSLKIPRAFQKARLKKNQTILSVSLSHGRLKALSIVKNTMGRSWERPGRVVSLDTLQNALEEAIYHTQFPGTHLAMLLDHPRLATRTIQIPPMILTDLLPFLERKVQQEKPWDGPAAWRYRIGLETRGKLHVHLDIWPQDYVDTIVHISQELGLSLRQLAPLSSLSESQLSTLPVEPGEGSILITMLEGNIIIVAGKDDGTPIWTRHLFPAHDWVPLGERVGTEVNRTIMFITQQTNLRIPCIWFWDDEERLTASEIQPHVNTPLVPFPIKPDWKFLLQVGAMLPVNLPNNFTPAQVLQAPLRNMLAKTFVAMLAVFILFGVGTTSVIEGYLARHRSAMQTMTEQITALQQDQALWESRVLSLDTKRQWVQSVSEHTIPELEGPFLSYLGSIIPTQVILGKAFLERTQEGWNVELDGRTSTNLAATLLVVDQFVQQLENGPYHVTLHEDWRDQLLTQTAISINEQPLYRFTLKGTMS